jgi:Fic family protein
MREHLEAINHQEAIVFIKNSIKKNVILSEKKSFPCILSFYEEFYLKKPVTIEQWHYNKIKALLLVNPQLFKRNRSAFFWYELNKNSIHPIILAATITERLLTIHPFINGNGKVSRLIMNGILLQHGYLIAKLRLTKIHASLLQNTKSVNNKEENRDLIRFIANSEKESLKQYLGIVNK